MDTGVSAKVAIELRDIDKSFGAVQANRGVNLSVAAGSIHGIVGENGAGKSTLMSILYGFYEADAGEILVDGAPVRIASSRDAIRHGIGMVHQHFMLVDTLSVLDNVMLGAEGGALVARGAATIRAKLAEFGRAYGLVVDPDALVGDLGVGLQQRVEILKALVRGATVLILDEPTAVLTPAEADQLFAMLDTLRREGKTVILITHKLREIMAVTDRVSVMRRGEMVLTTDTAATSPAQLADAMVGRRVLLTVTKGPAKPGPVRLEARNLTVLGANGVPLVSDVSFVIRGGEIAGVAGVAGNGQSELLEALAGIRPIASGEILIDGKPVLAAAHDPKSIRALGLAHVPEDRHRMGLVMPFEAAESAILGIHTDRNLGSGPWLSRKRMIADLARKMAGYDIRPPNPRSEDRQLLGRQPAEDRAGARDGARPRHRARGPADPRRRHRRHRVHPQAPRRSAGCRQGGVAGLGRARRDHGIVGPDPGHVRRPPHRPAHAAARCRQRRPLRGRTRAADGRRHGAGGVIPPRLSLVTLGVASVARSRAFYEALGWRASSASQEGVAFFQLGAMVLGLFGRADLAQDAGVADTPAGFAGVSLAQNLGVARRGRQRLCGRHRGRRHAAESAAACLLGWLHGLFRRSGRLCLGDRP